jgi:hypothetical protein
LSVNRNIPEQEVRLRRLEEVGAAQFTGHVAGKRQNRRVVATGFLEAGNQMCAAGAGGTGTYR